MKINKQSTYSMTDMSYEEIELVYNGLSLLTETYPCECNYDKLSNIIYRLDELDPKV